MRFRAITHTGSSFVTDMPRSPPNWTRPSLRLECGPSRLRSELHRRGRLRDECLNANWFTSLSDVRKIETWRQDYNQERPHSSLGYLSPTEFARTQAEMQA